MMSYSVLLVDDEDLITETVSMNLKEEGYEVVTSMNGEDGLRKFQKKSFDLVITDLFMEGMTGIEFSKKIKNLKPYIPIIFLTGYPSVVSSIEALRLGASDYIIKPCTPKTLSERVALCMQKLAIQKKINSTVEVLTGCVGCDRLKDHIENNPDTSTWANWESFFSKKTNLIFDWDYCPICKNKISSK